MIYGESHSSVFQKVVNSAHKKNIIVLPSYLFISESSSAPSSGENTLPVDFDTSVDSTLSNLTKTADVNCDKTGTCYDGKFTSALLMFCYS